VLIPLLALVLRPAELGTGRFLVGDLHATRVGQLAPVVRYGAGGAAIDSVFGFIIAWVLVRYRFPGKALLDAVIDLPFALPTAVAGIALSTLYAPNG